MPKGILIAQLVIVMLLGVLIPAMAQEAPTGTLVLELGAFESDLTLNKRARRQLEFGGLQWGVADDDVVIPLISAQYLNADLPHLTRYGEQTAIVLEAGQYRITCIGYVHSTNTRNLDKALSESAFVNEGVLTFVVEPGKTTTLRIRPVLQKQTKSSMLFKVKLIIPELWVSSVADAEHPEEISISRRSPSSVPWGEYSGPLKF